MSPQARALRCITCTANADHWPAVKVTQRLAEMKWTNVCSLWMLKTSQFFMTILFWYIINLKSHMSQGFLMKYADVFLPIWSPSWHRRNHAVPGLDGSKHPTKQGRPEQLSVLQTLSVWILYDHIGDPNSLSLARYDPNWFCFFCYDHYHRHGWSCLVIGHWYDQLWFHVVSTRSIFTELMMFWNGRGR